MEYHKIQSLFKRDTKGKFILGDYSRPEFELLSDVKWVATEKIDGTNIRIYKDGSIKGRTDRAQIPSRLMQVLLPIAVKLSTSDLPDSTILYGEGYGKKIQKGSQYLPNSNNFCLFDVNICGNWQPRESVEDIADKLDLSVAPILGVSTLDGWVNAIQNGWFAESDLHPSAKNEGYVLRPSSELQDRSGNRIITKLKFRDFE